MTSPKPSVPLSLADTATTFATEINNRLHRIVKTEKDLAPLLGRDPADPRVTVGVLEQDGFGTLPLTVDGSHTRWWSSSTSIGPTAGRAR
ncbi:hypothetical protein Psuf_036570 [Phytohabitans suffuscus]|uniref:Uncharacterized protein n=1 Tax=Phytohabitans suffuscus TaxID=624315 RepID=A0A6F8YJN3_9ACTN|nr:hypothetical protein Psuf_036570 [Phytohabitans suffuscus]